MLVAVIAAIALVGCTQTLSASSVKSGLEKAGYKVDTYDKNTFESAQLTLALETSKMEGLQSVVYAYKNVDDRYKNVDYSTDGILILIFDNIDHADKVGNTALALMNTFGRTHAPESDSSVVGTHNNVVWAGSSAARKAAGINI